MSEFESYELVCAKCQRRWLVSGSGAADGPVDLVPFTRPCPCGGKAVGQVPAAVLENTVEVREKP